MDNPNDPNQNPEDIGKQECMGRFKHVWSWVWVNGVMTNTKKCSTCGEEMEVSRFQGQ
jgi:hypothetical protein